ncbi:hypothetical protein J6590_069314 [Homalodisca vitripennis]|nr:hypothetical protein J6590_069314 [Homalodisca vitripennis]
MEADRPINIIEAHMADVIKLHKHDKKVGFVHSISGDFNSPHQMTAGVAIMFRNHFGRPNISHLITKDSYFGKPTKSNDDTAFKHLTENFKKRKLQHLICSPIGCVRDRVKLGHFINNITEFKHSTNARVTIVTYSRRPNQKLKNGITHEDLVARLKHLICTRSGTSSSPYCDGGVPLVNSNLMAAQVVMEEAEAIPSTTEMLPVADQLPTGSESSSMCDGIKVVPGVLTFSEALKQSNCASDLSALSCSNKVNSAKVDTSSIENGSMNSCYLINKELNLNHCTDTSVANIDNTIDSQEFLYNSIGESSFLELMENTTKIT